MSTELAAERATSTDLEWLQQSVDDSEALIDDSGAFTEVALGFHLTVAEASHNRILVAQLTALHHVLRPLYSRRTTREVATRVVTAHRELLTRIEAGDVEGARRLHLEGCALAALPG